jgi:hypothetical protein
MHVAYASKHAGSGERNILPPVNALIRVTISSSSARDSPIRAADVPSRVEDVPEREDGGDPDEFLIAAPQFRGDSEPPAPDTPCLVLWTTDRGLVELPAAYVATEDGGNGIRTWRLVVDGPAIRIERRRYFRVELTMPMHVEIPRSASHYIERVRVGVGGEMPEVTGKVQGDVLALPGHTVDISEGGVRCLLPPPALPPGADVHLSFTSEGTTLRMRSLVIRATPGRGDTEDLCETSLQFTEPGTYADVMRKVVYAEQLRLRRATPSEEEERNS